MFYDYLKETYGEDEPIFVSKIHYKNSSANYIQQQIKKLTDAGLIKKYDKGIYFIPQKSIFKSGSQLSSYKVIELKYLKDGNQRCGYVCGITFANQLGLTTQVPMVREITTNKATSDYRKIKIAYSPVILRKPKVEVTNDNYMILQLLDLLTNLKFYSEIKGKELTDRLISYMKSCGFQFDDLKRYLPLYPDKIYKNMYKSGLLYGLPA